MSSSVSCLPAAPADPVVKATAPEKPLQFTHAGNNRGGSTCAHRPTARGVMTGSFAPAPGVDVAGGLPDDVPGEDGDDSIRPVHASAAVGTRTIVASW